ncbi:MAG TPA: bifunctional phosphopantothenoylcysteine decarboxylase/phosphopantothenate--cysteine ligase CoaBC, partial [Bacteroidales bacterium]|nr:bifunctional phosphopantothenoylcysteine decarboxylase/phosphopantothenate--cysteine ligase CoaBC [Bacteroidales bacterium]
MLVRLLVREGAAVQVLMTPYAKEFITPLTLATLSKNPILVDFFNPENGDWNSHVDLGNWADLYLLAPATANTMGKMAHGIADNLLLTTYLSAKCDVMVAPAMDLDMYKHPANLRNIEALRSYGNTIIEAATGELASGLEGKGRMEEPARILEQVKQHFASKKKLADRRFVVTAGPTYERIDPVRFIGNYSSGKMGYALADALAALGASVDLISGPVSMQPKNRSVHVIRVASADEMYEQAVQRFKGSDGAVLAAAVSDYKPARQYDQKVKRTTDSLSLELEPTRDIAQKLGSVKNDSQLLVGFALETQDEVANAQKKIHNKNLDWIVLNSLNEEGAGFQVDTNKISIIDRDGRQEEYSLKSKKEVARDIAQKMTEKFIR